MCVHPVVAVSSQSAIVAVTMCSILVAVASYGGVVVGISVGCGLIRGVGGISVGVCTHLWRCWYLCRDMVSSVALFVSL